MSDRQVRAVVAALEQFTERLVSKITLDITANLIETTPRDTGWARANWVPAIGQPVLEDLSAILNPDAGNVSNARAEQAQGIASVATGFTLRAGSVFISNNVPYIIELNDGSSNQAPSGFVTAAIQKALTQDIRGFSG